jgi:hypothetical protein
LGQPFVHLAGSVEVVAGRPGRLMSASVAESQFRTLQPLQDDGIGVTPPLDLSVDDLVAGAAPLSPAPRRCRRRRFVRLRPRQGSLTMTTLMLAQAGAAA